MIQYPSMSKRKVLAKTDPHLLDAVGRHNRTQKTTGAILIAFGLLAQFVGISLPTLHPVAGLPFIAIGAFCVWWGDPALLAAAAVLFALAILPTVNPALTLPGPDPLVALTGMDGWELVIVVGVKAVLAFSTIQQFFLFRLLYGTERMTSDAADLDLIPPLVKNRTDIYARWARSAGLAAAVLAVVGVGFLVVDPQALGTRILAELASALGAAALGLGLGAAFSPTDERPAAVVGMAAGVGGLLAAAVTLLLV